MERLFGTDGVRGVANQELTPELVLKLGKAGALVLTEGKKRPKILIGKDTRVSGAMLEAALIAGITAVGADVCLLGVIPTPGVAYLTRALEADAGIMISASHNPVEDNGIKFFSKNGLKLSDEIEDEIESLVRGDIQAHSIGVDLGRVYHQENALELYLNFLLTTIESDFKNLHIAIDCAHGAASCIAPEVFKELGANVSILCAQPDGININASCGSTHPEKLQSFVVEKGADVGFAFDGDADRVLAVDAQGNLVDGDHILAIVGLDLIAKEKLNQKKIAATVYSNGGLIRALEDVGGEVVLTQAGDRYVLEAMLEQGIKLGGEQSGHIIFLEHNTTGDGILTALQLLAVMKSSGKSLAKLAEVMPVFPQELLNIRVVNKYGWEENSKIQAAIAEAESQLGKVGRIFVRASGTEPVIRIMGEHPDHALLTRVVNQVAEIVKLEQSS